MRLPSRGYWTQRGIIPRWQYFGVYVVIVAAGAVGFHQTEATSNETRRLSEQTHTQAARTNAALCALRHDLEVRVHNSEEFLATHPHGIAGIPASTIKTSLEGQRRTIKALSTLKC